MAGARFGDYEVLSELGRGAMGVVYLARERATGREVALKQLQRATLSPNARERFQREGAAVSRLQHPNLVRVHAAGVVESTPFIALDLVKGESLEARLDRSGPLPPEDALPIALALARGLAHAHAQGVVHRDVKPANVIVTPGGTPVLVDFGLAKLLDDEKPLSLTRTGILLGTAGYLAPEQAAGEGVRAGPPADVYGLGATLYAALTGVSPQGASSTVHEMAIAALSQAVPPSQIVPSLDRRLDALLLRCLAIDSSDRPTADDLARKLEGLLAVETPPPRRGPVAAGIAVAIVAAVTTVVWLRLGATSAEVAPPSVPPVTTSTEAPVETKPSPPPPPPPAIVPRGPERPADSRHLRVLAAWGDPAGQATEEIYELVLLDEGRLLSGGASGVWTWDSATGVLGERVGPPARAMDVHRGAGLFVTVSHPPRGVATSAVEVRTLGGELVRSLGQVTEASTRHGVAFSDDASHVAAVAANKPTTIKVWSVDGAPRLEREFEPGTKGNLWRVRFRPGRTDRVLVASDNVVIELDVDTGLDVAQYDAGNGCVFGMEVSPDGRLLTGTWTAQSQPPPNLRCRDLLGNSVLFASDVQGSAMRVCFLPGGKALSSDGSGLTWASVWDLTPGGGGRLGGVSAPDALDIGTVWAMTTSADGRRAWVGTSEGQLRGLDLERLEPLWPQKGHVGPVLALARSGAKVVSVGLDATRRTWVDGEEAPTSQAVSTWGRIDMGATTADGKRSVVGRRGHGYLGIFDDTKPMYAAELGGNTPIAVALAPDGARALVVTKKGELLRVDLAKGNARVVAPIALPGGPASCVAFASDGTFALLGDPQGTLTLWDPASNRSSGTLRSSAGAIRQLACVAARRLALSLGTDGRLWTYDLASGAERQLARDIEGVIADATGRLAAAWDVDHLRLWDLDTGAERPALDFAAVKDAVSCAAFSADARELLVGTRRGCVYRVEVRPGD